MAERGESERHPGAWRRLSPLFVAMVLIPAACSGSSSGESADAAVSTAPTTSGGTVPDESDTKTAPVGGSGVLRPADIDPFSEYVFALCRLDAASYLEDDDPLVSIAAAIEDLPVATDGERAEAAFLASSLTIAAEADNIVESPEMQQVVNLIQARCS
jgi:hypothetical protein